MAKKLFKPVALIVLLAANGTAFAYDPEGKEEVCKKPRFADFSLTEYKAEDNVEVAPESEFYFKLPPWTDPSTIKLTAKKQPLAFTVESNSSFHKVKAKLPASLNGQYVRLDASAKAILGCGAQDGWLVKVAAK